MSDVSMPIKAAQAAQAAQTAQTEPENSRQSEYYEEESSQDEDVGDGSDGSTCEYHDHGNATYGHWGDGLFPEDAPMVESGMFFSTADNLTTLWDPSWETNRWTPYAALWEAWRDSPGTASLADSLFLFTTKGSVPLKGRKAMTAGICGDDEELKAFVLIHDSFPGTKYFASTFRGKGPWLQPVATPFAPAAPIIPRSVRSPTVTGYVYPGYDSLHLVHVEGECFFRSVDEDKFGESGWREWDGLYLCSPSGCSRIGSGAPGGFHDINGDGFMDLVIGGEILIRSGTGFWSWTFPEGPTMCC